MIYNKHNIKGIICLNCSSSTLEKRAEYLWQWLVAMTQDDSPDATNWLKVDAIVHAEFYDGTLEKECTRQTVVLIEFPCIGLIEVLWKAVASLLNRWLASYIASTMCCTGPGRNGVQGPLLLRPRWSNSLRPWGRRSSSGSYCISGRPVTP